MNIIFWQASFCQTSVLEVNISMTLKTLCKTSIRHHLFYDILFFNRTVMFTNYKPPRRNVNTSVPHFMDPASFKMSRCVYSELIESLAMLLISRKGVKISFENTFATHTFSIPVQWHLLHSYEISLALVSLKFWNLGQNLTYTKLTIMLFVSF